MTAGSYMYIGPQGIVHGTTITIMNAGRKILKEGERNLNGRLSEKVTFEMIPGDWGKVEPGW
jgi:urocanate hydratase